MDVLELDSLSYQKRYWSRKSKHYFNYLSCSQTRIKKDTHHCKINFAFRLSVTKQGKTLNRDNSEPAELNPCSAFKWRTENRRNCISINCDCEYYNRIRLLRHYDAVGIYVTIFRIKRFPAMYLVQSRVSWKKISVAQITLGDLTHIILLILLYRIIKCLIFLLSIPIHPYLRCCLSGVSSIAPNLRHFLYSIHLLRQFKKGISKRYTSIALV